jgi:hypothetical protein
VDRHSGRLTAWDAQDGIDGTPAQGRGEGDGGVEDALLVADRGRGGAAELDLHLDGGAFQGQEAPPCRDPASPGRVHRRRREDHPGQNTALLRVGVAGVRQQGGPPPEPGQEAREPLPDLGDGHIRDREGPQT